MTGVLVLKRVFDARVRGIRWVEIIGVGLVAVMIVSVYAAKAAAARESSRIAQLEQEISANHQRVRLLRAEVARLEQPARLESLSRQAGLSPTDVHRQAEADKLAQLKSGAAKPAAAAPAAPSPAVNPAVDDDVAAMPEAPR